MAPADSRSDLSRQRRCGDEDVDEDEKCTLWQVLKALASVKEDTTAILVRMQSGAAATEPMESDPVASAVQPAGPVGIDDIDSIDGKFMYSNISEESGVGFVPAPYLFESICMAIVKKPAALPVPMWEGIDVSKVVDGISGGLVVRNVVGMRLGRRGDLFAQSMHARPFAAPESTVTAW